MDMFGPPLMGPWTSGAMDIYGHVWTIINGSMDIQVLSLMGLWTSMDMFRPPLMGPWTSMDMFGLCLIPYKQR